MVDLSRSPPGAPSPSVSGTKMESHSFFSSCVLRCGGQAVHRAAQGIAVGHEGNWGASSVVMGRTSRTARGSRW
jgi:hypothetical protein